MKKLTFFFWLIIIQIISSAQEIQYGNNPAAGKYLNVGDAKIYYEVYGAGRPLILLHGGFFGYIDEYADHIPDLSKNFKVIAIATRGHGKSEIGTKTYSEKLYAEDVLAILNKETPDSAIVVGFSAGAITALYLAASYPQKIRKVVALGGSLNNHDSQPGIVEKMKNWTYKDFKTKYPKFFDDREKLMPQPERAEEWLEKMKPLWIADVIIEEDKARQIKCPVLIVGGDRDDYTKPEGFVFIYRTIPNSQLAIIPKSNHVDLIFNPAVMKHVVMPFLQQQ